MKNTLVMKFGGSSIGLTTGLTQMVSIILQENERWARLFVVVSALEGVTDSLIEAAGLAALANQRGYRRIAATIRKRHTALIDFLPFGTGERAALQSDVDRLLFDMLAACEQLSQGDNERRQDELTDLIVGVGERVAARIIAAMLRQNNLRGVAIDATDLIITDSVYGDASANLGLTRERIERQLLPMMERRIIPVITGFIGATPAGKPTTLGRGGSDYTASVLASCADADEVWVWTDVDGMMTTDPREIDDARPVALMTYNEAAEMAFLGARVLHARMIAPLRDKHIPLRIGNIYLPKEAGTWVRDSAGVEPGGLKAVTMIQGLGIHASRGGSLAGVAALVDESLMEVTGTNAEVTITAQSSSRSFFCCVVPPTVGGEALHALLLAVGDRLSANPAMSMWTPAFVTVVTAIGERIGEMNTMTADVLRALDDVPVLAVTQSPAGCSFSVVVATHDAHRALERIHARIP